MTDEFEEIAHSGGQVTFHFRMTEEGRRRYQIQHTSSRPVPRVMIGVYALEIRRFFVSGYRAVH